MRTIIIGIGVALAACAGARAEWEVEAVAAAELNGDDSPSIAVDDGGQPHIAYVTTGKGYGLKYAVRSGGRWDVSDVDVGDVESIAGMVLDRKGRPCILCYSRAKRAFKYVRWTGGDWAVTTFDAGVRFDNVSFTQDGQDRPHVVYFDEAHDEVTYVRWVGGKLITETVADEPYVEGRTAIAVDRDGRPHISYWGGAGAAERTLKYARRSGSGFQVREVDADPDVRPEHTLALDADGTPFIIYYCARKESGIPKRSLKCARRTDAGWDVETFDEGRFAGDGSSLALDREGQPHVAYYTRHRLKFAHRTGKGWYVRTLATVPEDRWPRELSTAVALDAEDRPRIAYYDWGAKQVEYAAWNGGEWRVSADDPGEVDIDMSYVALAARWDPTRLRGGSGEPWRPVLTPDNYYGYKGYNGRIPLRAAPREDADVVGELTEDTRVTVVGGVSVWTTLDTIISVDDYVVWLKVQAGGLEGWVDQLPVRREFVGGKRAGWGDVVDLARVTFAEPYEPLYTGPGASYPVVRDEWGRGTEPGRHYSLLARCGDWYCIGDDWGGAWLPADAPGMTVEYLVAVWEPQEDQIFCFYVPDGDVIDGMLYTFRSYFMWAYVEAEDPRLTITTAEGKFVITPTNVRDYGFHETAQADYEAALPRPVKREAVTSITFAVGGDGERITFTLDPREAWAE
ncbi:MAG: SH3 domain-containing protein [Candidatus Zixiibacteriota bacterium]|jgi:hypothetical protein